MIKLNFERSAVFVLVLILLISTANISAQYIALAFQRKNNDTVQVGEVQNISFPVMLLRADKLYREGKFEEARQIYLNLSLNTTLSSQQKATASFKLGLSYFKLEQYDKAKDSFATSLTYYPNDPVAYNNAAVSAFNTSNFEMAEEYQLKAIASLPVVEYYYNLGRIYETAGNYDEAVKYFLAVARGEENITREDRIDLVRVKNKVVQLFPDKHLRDELSKDPLIALKLKDTRETLIIADSDMKIKSNEFEWHVDKNNKLFCTYDKKKLDPYNLISTLQWIVKSDGKEVYKSSKEQFSLKISEEKNYEVILSLVDSESKRKQSSIKIKRNSLVDRVTESQGSQPNDIKQVCKYYEYAVYEQVFKDDFKISTKGFTDRFNVRWGKDNISTEIMHQDFIDAESSLYIKNDSERDAGIWADFTPLLDTYSLKGKTISIKFYGRKITENAFLKAKASVKIGKTYKNINRNLDLDYKWNRKSMDISIPENAEGLTFSIRVKPGEEVKLDGFIISIVK